jgi:hypothetical protein
MASDIDRLIIDLQARMGGAESTIKQLGDVVKNLNRFALGGLFGSGTADVYAVWRSSVELKDSAFLKDTVDAVETTGDIVPIPTDEFTPSLGTDTPELKRYLTCFAETFLHDETHGILWGTGDPTPTGSAVVADVGTIYLQKDGSEGEMAWFKEAGDGTADGWTPGFFDGADRYLSNLALTDPDDPHTSQVQINADLLPGEGLLIDIGSLGEAFESLFLSHVYTGTLGSFGTALDPTTPVPIGLIDSILPAGGLSLGDVDNPFLDVFSTRFRFETGTGLFHGPTNPALGSMTGFDQGWLYVYDNGGVGSTFWVKETDGTSAVWTPVGAGGGSGSGPVNYLAKFTPTTTSIGQANIIDDGVNVSLIHTADDWVQLGFATTDTVPEPDESHLAIWRYDHRPAGLVDEGPTGSPFYPNLASGEMQLFLNSSISCVRLGEGRSYFTTGIAIKTPPDYPYGAFVVADTAGVPAFRVWPDGNLSIIRYFEYIWPDAMPYPAVAGAMKVLGYKNTSGPAVLQWYDPPPSTGGIAPGEVNKLVRYTPDTASLGPAGIIDDGVIINAIEPFGVWNQADNWVQINWNVTDVAIPEAPVPHNAIWRYERRTSGLVNEGPTGSPYFANLDSGEMQLFLDSSSFCIALGETRSYFTMGIAVKTPASYPYGAFTVADITGVTNFQVWPNGNLSIIKYQSYDWPDSVPDPASPTTPGTKVLGYASLTTGGTAQLQWVDRGESTSTGSGIVLGAPGTIGMFTATEVIGNSQIVDDRATLNTITATCKMFTSKYPPDTVGGQDDLAQFGWETHTGNYAIWRYEHRTAGLVNEGPSGSPYYPNLASGEMQLRLNSSNPCVLLGEGRSYFLTGIIVKTPVSYPGGALATADNSGVVNFQVWPDGNLSIIAYQHYIWPDSTPAPAVGFSKVLGYSNTTGIPVLQWMNPPSVAGGITGSVAGTTNQLAKFTGATTIGNSGVRDDDSVVYVERRFVINSQRSTITPTDDLSEASWLTGAGNVAIWRYEHRASGFPETTFSPNITSGEMQLILPGAIGPSVFLGAGRSYLTMDLAIKLAPSTAPGLTIGTTVATPAFQVTADGDLSMIKSVGYQWPNPIPTPLAGETKVLSYAAITGGEAVLQWVNLPTAATTNVSSLIGGTNQYIPKFTAAHNIEDSSIRDDGAGVIITNRDLEVIGPALTDAAQMDLKGVSGAKGLMRFQHADSALTDPGNASGSKGEMQFFLNPTGVSPAAEVTLGAQQSWFQMGVRIRPVEAYTSYPLEIRRLISGAESNTFRVEIDGNLALIKGQPYVWPASSTTTAGFVLSNTGDGHLQWAAPGTTGGGNVSSTAGGTHNKISRWQQVPTPSLPAPPGIPFAPTWLLVDSAIDDRTGPGGNGTVEIDCLQLLFKRIDSNDLSDFYMRTGANNTLQMRYERRGGGFMADSGSNSDEWQVYMGAATGGSPFGANVTFGNIHTWFTHGVRIRPTTANAGLVGNPLEIRQLPSGAPEKAVFYVEPDGNLSPLRGISYQWPTAAPVTNAVLTQTATTGLQWVVPSTSGGNVSTVGLGANTFIPKFTGSTTIEKSSITDDGAGVIITQRDLQVIGPVVGGVGLDSAQIGLMGASGGQGIMRFQHNAGNLADGNNASGSNGEMQFFLNGTAPGLSPHVFFGAQYSWFQMPLRVRPVYGNPNHPFEVHQLDTSSTAHVAFRIRSDGDVAVIRNMAYTWPAGPAPPLAAGFPPNNTVLTHTASGVLSWAVPSGGLSGGSGGYLPRWTGASTLGLSGIYDDGTAYISTQRTILPFTGYFPSIGNSGNAFQEVWGTTIFGGEVHAGFSTTTNPAVTCANYNIGLVSPSGGTYMAFVANNITAAFFTSGGLFVRNPVDGTAYRLTSTPTSKPVYFE